MVVGEVAPQLVVLGADPAVPVSLLRVQTRLKAPWLESPVVPAGGQPHFGASWPGWIS